MQKWIVKPGSGTVLVEEKVKETNKIIVQSVPDSFFVLPDFPPKEQKNKIF